MNFSLWKKDIITGLVVLSIFLFFVFTPEVPSLGGVVQGFILMIIFFAIIPLCYHFLILRQSRSMYGLTFTFSKRAWVEAGFSVLGAFLLTVLFSRLYPGFLESYNLPLLVKSSFGWFLLYEIVLVPTVLLLFELFFRGFIQGSWLQSRLGGWEPLIQTGVFLLFLLATKSLAWGVLPLIIFTPLCGILFARHRSLLYPLLAFWVYLLLIDVYFLVMG